MILGIDHIALSCKDVVSGAKKLGEIGYKIKFVHEDLPNHSAKRHLLRFYEPIHSVAYCQAQHSVSVELTQHSSPLRDDAASPFQVLLNRPPANALPFRGELLPTWESTWSAALGCSKTVAALWEPFCAQVWYVRPAHEASRELVSALLVPIIDLSISERFWVRGLGCRVANRGVDEDGRRWTRVSFRAPVRSWSLDVVLAEDGRGNASPYLDDAGFPCLAVITNRIADDQDVLLKMGGGDASKRFAIEVGGKMLGIVVLRGPDNELIELIEVQRR